MLTYAVAENRSMSHHEIKEYGEDTHGWRMLSIGVLFMPHPLDEPSIFLPVDAVNPGLKSETWGTPILDVGHPAVSYTGDWKF